MNAGGRVAGPLQPPRRPTEPTLAPASLVAALGIALALAAVGRTGRLLDLGVRRPLLAAPAALRAALSPSPDAVPRALWEEERTARRLAEARHAEAVRTLRALGVVLPAGETAVWVAAPSWGFAPSPAVRRLLVGAGEEAGVRRGAAVAAAGPDGEPCLVGRVVEVDSAGAAVLAVTDPASAVPVRVEGYGAGGLLLQGVHPRPGARILHVPRGAPVRVGAEVRTAPGVPDLPAGLLVGTVASIGEGDGDFLDVRVALPVHAAALRAVLVARSDGDGP